MNIQQLKCFVEVSKTLNFTKASQNLFISQTAVSNHIKHLEENTWFSFVYKKQKACSVNSTRKNLFKKCS